MKRSSKIAVGVVVWSALVLAGATATAQPFGMGPGMMRGMGHDHGASGHGPMMGQGMGPGMGFGPVGMLTTRDANSAADMGVAMNLVHNNTKIRRTVTNLPNGIRTVTESDDPQVAQTIKAHVASMSQRLKDGREFIIFSKTLPVLFENRDKIQSTVEVTEKGSIVTRTSTDPKVVAALQGHAAEVTELANEGPVAMMRGMMSRMATAPGGLRPAP
jgi:hypothetical protein